MVVSECSLVIKALFPLWWIISSWSGKNLNLASSYRMCRFFFSWASRVVLSGIGRYAASIRHHLHPPPREYSLIWPIWGRAAGQGMGLVLSVPKRAHNSAQVCPKWGIFLGIFWSYKESWFETLSSSPIPNYWSSTTPPPPPDIHPVSMSQWPMYQLQYFLTLYLS